MMLVQLVVVLALTSPAAALVIPTRQDVQAKVAGEASCTLDKEIEFDIAAGSAHKLNVKSNPFGVAEALVYADAKQKLLWTVTYDKDGKMLSRGGRAYERIAGAIDQVAYLPCAALTKWQISGSTFNVRFLLSSNKTRNQAEMEAAIASWKNPKTIAINSCTRDFCLPPRVPLEDRLLGFTKFWSEVKYNFAFFSRMPDLDWDKVLVEYIPRIEKAGTYYEYLQVMGECCALLKDGHTNYGGYSGPGPYCPPIGTRCIAGKAIIESVNLSDDRLDAGTKEQLMKANLRPGDEITHVDGLAVPELLKKSILPYICASTPQDRDRKAYQQILLGEYGTQVSITVKSRDGGSRELRLTRTCLPLSGKPNEFEFRKLDNDIGYVNLPGFDDSSVADEFDKLADQLAGLKGLVIDIRRNSGGSSSVGYRIISHLIETPLKDTLWKTRDYRPSFRAWGRKEGWYNGEGEEVKPAGKKYFLGPIVLLTSPGTYSAAEDFAVVLHAGKRVTIVGEKTGGSTGQPLYIDLPFIEQARICTKWDTYPDGREFVGVGIIPDVEIGPSAEDIATGRDAVLEKGVEVLKGLMAASAK